VVEMNKVEVEMNEEVVMPWIRGLCDKISEN